MSADRAVQLRECKTRHTFMGVPTPSSAGTCNDFRGSETTLDDIKSQWQKAKEEFDQKSSDGTLSKKGGQLKLPANIE